MAIRSSIVCCFVLVAIANLSLASVLNSFCDYQSAGFHAHPERCDQYVVCSSGHKPTVMDCPEGLRHQKLFFNPELKVCDYQRNVKHCGGGTEVIEAAKTVCYGAKDDTYGVFIVKETGYIRSVTLKHVSGEVSCFGDKPETFSYWGCSNLFAGKINVHLALHKDVLLFPNPSVHLDEYFFYNLPGKNENSDEITFVETYERVQVEKGEKLQIWYGEDLHDSQQERLNTGRHCVEVYVEYY